MFNTSPNRLLYSQKRKAVSGVSYKYLLLGSIPSLANTPKGNEPMLREHKYIFILKLGTPVMLVFLASCTNTKYIPTPIESKPNIKSLYYCLYGPDRDAWYYNFIELEPYIHYQTCEQWDADNNNRVDLHDYQSWLNRK